MRMLQQPDKITILYGDQVRHVRMNEPHPTRATPSLHGDSIGRYEGDTLVVDTVGIRTDGRFPRSTCTARQSPKSCMWSNAIGCSTMRTRMKAWNGTQKRIFAFRRIRFLPTTEDHVYHARKRRSLPIGRYNKHLCASKKKLSKGCDSK
jgi:hypothetical protein